MYLMLRILIVTTLLCRLKSFGYCGHAHFVGIVPREAEATAMLDDQGASVVYSRHKLLSCRRSPAVRVLKSTHVNTLSGCGPLPRHTWRTHHPCSVRSQTEIETTVSKQKRGNTGSHHSDRSSPTCNASAAGLQTCHNSH